MPAYNFKPEFVPDIESFRKRCTIRRRRKHGNAVPGKPLQIYTEQRTKHCRKIIPDPECLSVTPIYIDDAFVCLDGKRIDWDEVHEIAIADGFKGVRQFLNFFDEHYGLPFDNAVLIKW